MKVRGKRPLEGAPLEEAIISALKAGKTAFIQSDFLCRYQEDYEDGAFPEASWVPPRESDEWREFENSQDIYRHGPDVYYAVIPDRKRKSHSHSKK